MAKYVPSSNTKIHQICNLWWFWVNFIWNRLISAWRACYLSGLQSIWLSIIIVVFINLRLPYITEHKTEIQIFSVKISSKATHNLFLMLCVFDISALLVQLMHSGIGVFIINWTRNLCFVNCSMHKHKLNWLNSFFKLPFNI